MATKKNGGKKGLQKKRSSGGHGSGIRAGDQFKFDPDEVVLIGKDTDDGPEHPQYDRKVCAEASPVLVESMRLFGQFVPITFYREAGKVICSKGRGRVKAARVILSDLRREAEKAGKDPKEVEFYVIGIPGKPMDEATQVATKHAENLNRRIYDASDEADAVQEMLAHHASRRSMCAVLGISPSQLDERIALLKLSGPVRKAVDDGRLSASGGVELSKLSRADQIRKLKELTEGGTKPSVRQIKNKVRESQGKHPNRDSGGQARPPPWRGGAPGRRPDRRPAPPVLAGGPRNRPD